jgi:hypothetical protein
MKLSPIISYLTFLRNKHIFLDIDLKKPQPTLFLMSKNQISLHRNSKIKITATLKAKIYIVEDTTQLHLQGH